jgi:hypothetical protein
MGAFGRKRGLIGLALAGFLYSSAAPAVVRADGKDGGTPPAKTETTKAGAAKVDAPAPLTERERWMLERMEQLVFLGVIRDQTVCSRVQKLNSRRKPSRKRRLPISTPSGAKGSSTPTSGCKSSF